MLYQWYHPKKQLLQAPGYFFSDEFLCRKNDHLSFSNNPPGTFSSLDKYSSILLADGLLIKATPQTIQTISYTGGINVVEWSIRQSPNTPVLPSSVLACTTVGNTLYAVVEGTHLICFLYWLG
jgi:hypothetical protein